jgi:CubicO group peptidase (beta-lactamase class C family)
MTKRRLMAGTAAFIILVQAGVCKLAYPMASKANSELDCPARGVTDPNELKVFIDQFFARALREEEIPGAVFVLVKDGKIFFSSGYGHASMGTRVDPDKTLFRVSSITKLFTATAVMQLVEEGKIDLNEDINKYLKHFQIEYRYDKPITVANLLTHTDGFDVQWHIGQFARTRHELKPLGTFLAENLPQQVSPPGSLYLYSDVGMTLAGYLVEEVAGSSLSSYIEERILRPLDMRNSTLDQPLPDRFENNLALANYKYGKDYRTIPFLYFNAAPAGALSATATDMAHFMIAHLQNGRYGGRRILTEDTAQNMHRRHFAYDARMPGIAYGFRVDENYPRKLYHGGEAPGSSSIIVLLPGEGVGFFASLNFENKQVIDRLTESLLERYYPAVEGQGNARAAHEARQIGASSSAHQLERFAGAYRHDEYPRTTFDKICLLAQEWYIDQRVRVEDDNTLLLLPEKTKWVQVEPLAFRQLGRNSRLVFGQDQDGAITAMFKDGDILRYERLSWFETIPFQKGLIAYFALVFITPLAVWLSAYLLRLSRRRSSRRSWRHSRRVHKSHRILVAAKYLGLGVSLLHLGLLIGLWRFLKGANEFSLIWGMPLELSSLLLIPYVSLLATLLLSVFVALSWKRGEGSAMARSYYSFIDLSAVAFLLFLNHWNLLRF